jgi:hypothetical protein
MTTERDPGTRLVLSWLREEAHENAERVLLRALDVVDTTPQRRPLWPARRSPDMHVSTKLGLAAAAVVVALLAGYQLLPRTGSSGGTPNATPTAPIGTSSNAPTSTPAITQEPGPSPVPYSSTPATGLLTPGSIVLDGAFPVAIAFDVPAGWSRHGGAEGADYVGLAKMRGQNTPAGVSWTLISNVFPDACKSDAGPADPPTGPTVDDLVTALTTIIGFEATTPTNVTVDGHAGKRFKITATVDPGADGCDDPVWLSLWEPAGDGPTAQVPAGTSLEFWIVDVDGTRLVMFAEDYGATADEFAEAVAIMESVRFQ